jgi:AcrR family transcriptional regulator
MNGRQPNRNASSAARRGAAPSLNAREQLIRRATAIFAAKGFAAASTREICDAAGVNVASIHYYFGDKEGLYRETLLRPITRFIDAFGSFDDPALPFEKAIRMFLAPFLGASCDAQDADLEAQVMKMHLREMLEPSGAFREIVERTIAPAHGALVAMLARHCGLAAPDDDIHQLAFAMVAMANDYGMSREMMKLLAPGVLDRPQANEKILDRLVGYSRALLDHETARRSGR